MNEVYASILLLGAITALYLALTHASLVNLTNRYNVLAANMTNLKHEYSTLLSNYSSIKANYSVVVRELNNAELNLSLTNYMLNLCTLNNSRLADNVNELKSTVSELSVKIQTLNVSLINTTLALERYIQMYNLCNGTLSSTLKSYEESNNTLMRKLASLYINYTKLLGMYNSLYVNYTIIYNNYTNAMNVLSKYNVSSGGFVNVYNEHFLYSNCTLQIKLGQGSQAAALLNIYSSSINLSAVLGSLGSLLVIVSIPVGKGNSILVFIAPFRVTGNLLEASGSVNYTVVKQNIIELSSRVQVLATYYVDDVVYLIKQPYYASVVTIVPYNPAESTALNLLNALSNQNAISLLCPLVIS